MRNCHAAGCAHQQEPYILNVFDFRLLNEFAESCNNAIKVFEKVTLRFRNFCSFKILISYATFDNES
ncbi:MAG TPA: transposase, partial [Candidatus Pullichristensenella stercoripullorum]|nr:transposase [Candidatus Pullichristensenella stercoripullorum]